MASSSWVKGSIGITDVRSGMSRRMITGKPMAASSVKYYLSCLPDGTVRGRRTDCLHDCKGGPKTNKLQGNEEDNAGLSYIAQGFVSWR